MWLADGAPHAPRADEPDLEGVCGRQPGLICRLTWNLTHNDGVSRFVDTVLADSLVVLVRIALILAVAYVARRMALRLISRVVDRMADAPPGKRRNSIEGSSMLLNERRMQRSQTMGSVLRSITSVAIFTVAALMVFSELGLDLAPLIASAGIVGVAVGFGAQNLVRDFLSGMFMLLEDQYGVGDEIVVGSVAGTVEAVTLRITRVRDLNGVVWYLRNGEITSVGNESQNWARAVLDIPVSTYEDVDTVRRIIDETSRELDTDPPWDELILEPPSIWGVEALSGEAVVFRVVIKTVPLQQWAVARELRERLKRSFDEAGARFATHKLDTETA